MKSILSLFSFVFLLCACMDKPAPIISEEEPTPIQYDEQLQLAEGFRAAVVADGVGRARHLTVGDNGDIYVQLRQKNKGGGIVALRDTNGDVKADIVEYFGDTEGTGIGIYNNHLYASSDVAVFRYPLSSDLVPKEEERVLIAGGFLQQNQHASKSLTFDGVGNMYVNVGSPSNACMRESRTAGSPGLDPCPQLEWQGGIWRFDANKAAQQQQSDGYRYAQGIRNTVGLAWNTNTNSLFVMQHGRDQLHDMFPDLYSEETNAELPSEELLSVSEGSDFGWPYCYFDHFQDKKMLAPEYGGDGTKQGRCAGIQKPTMAFPGHLAPNALLFYTGDQFPERYKNGAFIAFHGSWNRAPLEQKGYFVVFVPMNGTATAGEWEVFASEFAGISPVASPRDAKARPTGLAQGPDGAIYVADSVEGKIWKIMYKG